MTLIRICSLVSNPSPAVRNAISHVWVDDLLGAHEEIENPGASWSNKINGNWDAGRIGLRRRRVQNVCQKGVKMKEEIYRVEKQRSPYFKLIESMPARSEINIHTIRCEGYRPSNGRRGTNYRIYTGPIMHVYAANMSPFDDKICDLRSINRKKSDNDDVFPSTSY